MKRASFRQAICPPRRERCSLDENAITNALMKLVRTEDRKLVFLTGHGERSEDTRLDVEAGDADQIPLHDDISSGDIRTGRVINRGPFVGKNSLRHKNNSRSGCGKRTNQRDDGSDHAAPLLLTAAR